MTNASASISPVGKWNSSDIFFSFFFLSLSHSLFLLSLQPFSPSLAFVIAMSNQRWTRERKKRENISPGDYAIGFDCFNCSGKKLSCRVTGVQTHRVNTDRQNNFYVLRCSLIAANITFPVAITVLFVDLLLL